MADPMTASIILAAAVGVVVLGLLILWLMVGRRRPLRELPVRGRPTRTEHAATHHAIWMPVAQELGLTLEPPEQQDPSTDDPTTRTVIRMTGRRRDVGVTVEVHIPTAIPASVWKRLQDGRGVDATSRAVVMALDGFRILVDVPISAPLPAGLDVRPRTAAGHALQLVGLKDLGTGNPVLDNQIHVQGDHAGDTRALLEDRRVQTALGHLSRLDVPYRWIAERVRITVHPARVPGFRPGRVQAHADAATGLASAAAMRQAAPWRELGGTLGLDWTGTGLQGRVSGVPLSVECGFDRGTAVVMVAAAFGALRLAATDPGGPGEPVKFPNPVLGRALAGRTTDPFLARRVLSDEACMTGLIDVLRGTEGAALVDGTLRIPVRPAPDTPERLEAAVRLAQRLVRRNR